VEGRADERQAAHEVCAERDEALEQVGGLRPQPPARRRDDVFLVEEREPLLDGRPPLGHRHLTANQLDDCIDADITRLRAGQQTGGYTLCRRQKSAADPRVLLFALLPLRDLAAFRGRAVVLLFNLNLTLDWLHRFRSGGRARQDFGQLRLRRHARTRVEHLLLPREREDFGAAVLLLAERELGDDPWVRVAELRRRAAAVRFDETASGVRRTAVAALSSVGVHDGVEPFGLRQSARACAD
jgi:hypothetical protein